MSVAQGTFNVRDMCNFKQLGVAEIAHPTTTARLIGRSMSSDMASINLLRAEIETAHSSKLVGAFVKAIFIIALSVQPMMWLAA